MNKFKSVKVFLSLLAICLFVFGQNCSKGFETFASIEASSTKKTGENDENDSKEPDPVLTDAERLGLKGRIAADEIAIPMDSTNVPIPVKLSETKLFKNLAALEVNSGLIPFDVNMPLWSDGALKKRWYALPAGEEKIVFSAEDNWIFPKGTILVKQFDLQTNPTTIRRIETRVSVHEITGWKGYSYKWNDEQTDADLVPSIGAQEIYSITDLLGASRQQTWAFPSREQCNQCHGNGGYGLGLRTLQLNKSVNFGSTSINQLQILKELKLISDDMPEPNLLPAFPTPDNNLFSIESRARAYLSVNCGTCHSGAKPPRSVRLLHSVALADMNIVNVAAGQILELPEGAVRIKPGVKENSTLYLRINRTGNFRMPAVGSLVIDKKGVDLIGQWIDSLN